MIPTLDDFVRGAVAGRTRNSYVRFHGFKDLYVRYTKRHINGGIVSPVFDIANMTARRPGRGSFAEFFSYLREAYPEFWLYVESVLNERFQRKLLSMGFIQCGGEDPPSFYLPPVDIEKT